MCKKPWGWPAVGKTQNLHHKHVDDESNTSKCFSTVSVCPSTLFVCILLVMFNVSPCILIGVSCYCFGNNLRKQKQEKWHLASSLQASVKWASGSCKAKNLDAQEQPHHQHPKLKAARLGLLRLRHFCHCAQVRLLACILVNVLRLACDHVTVHDQPLSKQLSHLLHNPDQVKRLSHIPCHLHRCFVLIVRVCLREVRVHALFHELRVQRLAGRRRHRCRHRRRLGPLRLQHRSRRSQSRHRGLCRRICRFQCHWLRHR